MKTASGSAYDEDRGILAGMRDFMCIIPGERAQQDFSLTRLNAVVPNRFVAEYIKVCRRSGMTKLDFAKALHRDLDEARDVFYRYTTGRGQMTIDLMERLIFEAKKNKWIDPPVPPDMPVHPVTLAESYGGYGRAPLRMVQRSVLAWEHHAQQQKFELWRERLRALRACVLLARRNLSPRCKKPVPLTLHNVRQVAIVELDFEKEMLRDASQFRTLSQQKRRAQETIRAWYEDDPPRADEAAESFWMLLDMTQFCRKRTDF